jgi:rhodanese-related sulfurtransferase
MKKLFAVLVVGVALLSACSSNSTAAIVNMDVSEFADVITNQDIVILDVRTPAEFASGRIANAINIDAESGNFVAEIQALDKTKTYAVYCRSGRRSGVAAETMANAGFTSLYNMNGGTIDWTNSGFPLTTN